MKGCATTKEKQNWVLRSGVAWIAFTFLGCASTPKSPTSTPPTSAAVGNNTTIVAIAPAPSASNCTLPQFLGLPNVAKGAGGILQRLGSRLLNGLDLTGRFPGLQPQPPVLPITDPANLGADAPPAVQAAAEIKQEEDAAPQKIMAIRYLATLGCGGCYSKVEDALLEGLSDCTEEVRFEAVKALQCKPECGCKFCSSPSCCSMKVRKRLEELTTCEKEPSERIRRLARLALACCNTKPLTEEDVPREGPPAPGPETASLTPNTASNLFDGIQLVRFEENLSTELGEMVLAKVNGEPIFESQVLPLVEARLRQTAEANPNDPILRRKQLALEVTRFIDWKLISQQSKNEVRLATTGIAPSIQSPQEIQSWFERQLQLETTISSQELLAHYEINKEKFRIPTRVRWERLSVKIADCSSHEVAFAIATYLRNRTLGINVEPPPEYSRDKVETKTNGWTDLASIKSESERTALKQLQPGQVSNTLESSEGLHLVRLLERQDEGYESISSVVDRIRSEILIERKRAAEFRLIAQLRSQSEIWTVFDSPIPSNKVQVPSASTIPASTEWQQN